MKWPAILALASSAVWTATAKACPGYTASNVEESDYGLTADLTLAGDSCDVYGEDLTDLRLIVEYQTGRFPGHDTASLPTEHLLTEPRLPTARPHPGCS